jgi:tetratricopeptide (TPR) repeat protein
VLESDPSFAPAYDDLGRAYEQKGMYREAIHAFQRAVEYSTRGSSYVASLAHACALAGRRREALKLLKELEKRATKEYVPAYPFALVYTGLNQKDKAFAWLAKACDERSGAIPFLKVNPRLVSLRGDPRFEGLLSRLGLAVRANA